jgi:hypothetical protein
LQDSQSVLGVQDNRDKFFLAQDDDGINQVITPPMQSAVLSWRRQPQGDGNNQVMMQSAWLVAAWGRWTWTNAAFKLQPSDSTHEYLFSQPKIEGWQLQSTPGLGYNDCSTINPKQQTGMWLHQNKFNVSFNFFQNSFHHKIINVNSGGLSLKPTYARNNWIAVIQCTLLQTADFISTIKFTPIQQKWSVFYKLEEFCKTGTGMLQHRTIGITRSSNTFGIDWMAVKPCWKQLCPYFESIHKHTKHFEHDK